MARAGFQGKVFLCPVCRDSGPAPTMVQVVGPRGPVCEHTLPYEPTKWERAAWDKNPNNPARFGVPVQAGPGVEDDDPDPVQVAAERKLKREHARNTRIDQRLFVESEECAFRADMLQAVHRAGLARELDTLEKTRELATLIAGGQPLERASSWFRSELLADFARNKIPTPAGGTMGLAERFPAVATCCGEWPQYQRVEAISYVQCRLHAAGVLKAPGARLRPDNTAEMNKE